MFSKEVVQRVWEKAKKIHGQDPDKYRLDPYKTLIYRYSYGKTSKMGWEIDHIKPRSEGGSDDIRNLQALHFSKNRSLGNSIRKRSRHSKRNK